VQNADEEPTMLESSCRVDGIVSVVVQFFFFITACNTGIEGRLQGDCCQR